MTAESLSLEERVAALEVLVEELRGASPRPGSETSPPMYLTGTRPAPVAAALITVELISKLFHKADILAGEGGDQIELTLRFKSGFAKDIRAVKGILRFKDLFDAPILDVTLTLESALPAGQTVDWEGGIGFNQFMPPHQRLLTIKMEDLGVSFSTSMIFFADGTRETFELERNLKNG